MAQMSLRWSYPSCFTTSGERDNGVPIIVTAQLALQGDVTTDASGKKVVSVGGRLSTEATKAEIKALAADLIVASTAARFWLPEAQLGMLPDSGGLLRLPHVVSRPRRMAAGARRPG